MEGKVHRDPIYEMAVLLLRGWARLSPVGERAQEKAAVIARVSRDGARNASEDHRVEQAVMGAIGKAALSAFGVATIALGLSKLFAHDLMIVIAAVGGGGMALGFSLLVAIYYRRASFDPTTAHPRWPVYVASIIGLLAIVIILEGNGVLISRGTFARWWIG